MDDSSEDLSQFISITGVDNDRARFYLESSAGDLQVNFCVDVIPANTKIIFLASDIEIL